MSSDLSEPTEGPYGLDRTALVDYLRRNGWEPSADVWTKDGVSVQVPPEFNRSDRGWNTKVAQIADVDGHTLNNLNFVLKLYIRPDELPEWWADRAAVQVSHIDGKNTETETGCVLLLEDGAHRVFRADGTEIVLNGLPSASSQVGLGVVYWNIRKISQELQAITRHGEPITVGVRTCS